MYASHRRPQKLGILARSTNGTVPGIEVDPRPDGELPPPRIGILLGRIEARCVCRIGPVKGNVQVQTPRFEQVLRLLLKLGLRSLHTQPVAEEIQVVLTTVVGILLRDAEPVLPYQLGIIERAFGRIKFSLREGKGIAGVPHDIVRELSILEVLEIFLCIVQLNQRRRDGILDGGQLQLLGIHQIVIPVRGVVRRDSRLCGSGTGLSDRLRIGDFQLV